MDRTTRWTRLLLAAGVLVSGAALWRGSVAPCDACSVGGAAPLALAGACFYSVLLLASLLGAHAFVFCGVAAAIAVHGTLVGFVMSTGSVCLLCLTAFGNAIALFALNFAADPDNPLRAAFIIPLTATLVGGGLLFAPQARQTLLPADRVAIAKELTQTNSELERVQLVVFEKADCPFCWEVKERLIPRLRAELARNSPDIQYRDASELPGIRYTPTLVITSAGRDPVIFEGLPAYETLLSAVQGVTR